MRWKLRKSVDEKQLSFEYDGEGVDGLLSCIKLETKKLEKGSNRKNSIALPYEEQLELEFIT